MAFVDPSYGAASPLMTYMRGLGDKARSIGQMMGLIPPTPQPAPVSNEAQQQSAAMNQGAVDRANASFQHPQPDVTKIQKPLRVK